MRILPPLPAVAILFILVAATLDASASDEQFRKETFKEPASGLLIRLVSPAECELKIHPRAPILLSEYTLEGGELRVVTSLMGTRTVSYFSVSGSTIARKDAAGLELLSGIFGTAWEAGDAPEPSREGSQAVSILNDARILDGAVNQYMLENNIETIDPATVDIRGYVKSTHHFHSGVYSDLLGNNYIITPDGSVKVNEATKEALKSMIDDPEKFWAGY